jgi:two-component sensor histidine kinase
VTLDRSGKSIELVVEDNGIGMDGSGGTRGTGLGSRLVATYAKQLKAKYDLYSGVHGTRHVFRIPG